MTVKMEPVTHQEVANGDSHIEDRPREKGGIMNTLYPPGPRPGAGPRMKNHLKKFWWCDCLVLVIIVLIIVLPIIYVAIPKKAQKDINASTLEVNMQEVTEATPDSVHIAIDSTARSSSSFHPTIEGFRAALYLEGQEPFLYADVPETKAEAETSIKIRQNVQIANKASFIEYNKVVIGSEEFEVFLSGKTKVHQSGLSAISVDYDKRIKMKGLNKLAGLNITNLRILSGNATLPDGSNLVGRVIIPNPSVLTIDLGNVTMNLAVNGKAIGTSFLPDLVLKPGVNNVTMQSKVDQLQVFDLVRKNYTNAILPLDIVGNSSVRNGQNLPYFEAAIRSNSVRVDLNVGPPLAALGLYNATRN
ncbi:hypothetical protein DM02DRAFT_43523 [Periconia macrospinosa]|uniref:DUF3712 domain-containing protein n=1 Tax=Periconia macrospinosa TaxID=97972 RepID=A0A2V1DL73_9PLEO|nr:hypothetical protein DM02DRAFT_43523 [Periconia macrospinosa]